jgi:hypothetical protein
MHPLRQVDIGRAPPFAATSSALPTIGCVHGVEDQGVAELICLPRPRGLMDGCAGNTPAMDDDLGDQISGFEDGVSRFYRDGILVEARSEVALLRPPTPEPAGLSQSDRERFRELIEEERAISETRRRLHDRIDFIRSQGETTETEAVLRHLTERERTVSAERERLHRLIDSM